MLFRSAPSDSTGGFSDNASDAVPYSSLNWVYGGKSLPGAVSEGVRISGLNLASNGYDFSFKFDADLSAWGYNDKKHAEYLCVFLKNNEGRYIGGMIHWQNSANPASNFHNIYPNTPGSLQVYGRRSTSYNGWHLGGIPNPCEMAFVIVEGNGRRRSNVLKATWSWNDAWR